MLPWSIRLGPRTLGSLAHDPDFGCLALAMILASGCGTSSSVSDEELAALLAPPEPTGSRELVHDFGPILAHGQTLRHEFTLANPTDRPLKIVSAQAQTPCCSAVGPHPEMIPPGGTATLPVLLKPGSQSGRKRFRFIVQTDSTEQPGWVLSLIADLTAELEMSPIEGFDASLPLGQPGHQRFRIVCHRVGDVGLGAPDAVTVGPPLSARFLGPADEAAATEGPVESTRIVEVDLPASTEPGSQRGELILHWPDGQERSFPIAWQVVARIAIEPSGLVLRPTGEPITRSVLVTCGDRPFRITGVSGPLLADPPPRPAAPRRLHRLELVLDPSLVESGTTDIRIDTDHPDQPTIVLSVLVLPATVGGAE